MQTFGEYVVKPANTYVLVPTGNTFSFLLTCGGRGPRSRRVYSLNANPTPYQDLEGGEQNGEACDSKTAATVAMGAAGALGLTYIIAPAFFTAEGFAAAIDFVMRPTAEEQCEDGLLIPGPMPSLFNVFFYMALLLWSFAGVAIAADIFMVAIEYITSQTSTKLLQTQHGVKPMTVYIWNATVANLTLMALGSSAPEILLSIIEIVSSGCYAGALGPSTIVGSAAFNLLGISTVCVLAIPAGQTRYVKEVPVFFCTAFFSVFAYAWLYFILVVCTPNIVDASARRARTARAHHARTRAHARRNAGARIHQLSVYVCAARRVFSMCRPALLLSALHRSGRGWRRCYSSRSSSCLRILRTSRCARPRWARTRRCST
jgi:hypothetical protein